MLLYVEMKMGSWVCCFFSSSRRKYSWGVVPHLLAWLLIIHPFHFLCIPSERGSGTSTKRDSPCTESLQLWKTQAVYPRKAWSWFPVPFSSVNEAVRLWEDGRWSDAVGSWAAGVEGAFLGRGVALGSFLLIVCWFLSSWLRPAALRSVLVEHPPGAIRASLFISWFSLSPLKANR